MNLARGKERNLWHSLPQGLGMASGQDQAFQRGLGQINGGKGHCRQQARVGLCSLLIGGVNARSWGVCVLPEVPGGPWREAGSWERCLVQQGSCLPKHTRSPAPGRACRARRRMVGTPSGVHPCSLSHCRAAKRTETGGPAPACSAVRDPSLTGSERGPSTARIWAGCGRERPPSAETSSSELLSWKQNATCLCRPSPGGGGGSLPKLWRSSLHPAGASPLWAPGVAVGGSEGGEDDLLPSRSVGWFCRPNVASRVLLTGLWGRDALPGLTAGHVWRSTPIAGRTGRSQQSQQRRQREPQNDSGAEAPPM